MGGYSIFCMHFTCNMQKDMQLWNAAGGIISLMCD